MRLWFPGATRQPGPLPGGYWRAGRTRMRAVKIHYTVGIDSAYLGGRYFQILVRRNGEVVAFCPIDAYCWDSGEWNGEGPGIEFEYYPPKDGPPPESILTPEQIASAGPLFRWLHFEHGFPLSYYDAPASRINRGYRGFISHRSLIQKVMHHDWISHAQWARIIGITKPAPAPTVPTDEEDDPMLITFATNNTQLLIMANRYMPLDGPVAYSLAVVQKRAYMTGLNPLAALAVVRDLCPEQFNEEFRRG